MVGHQARSGSTDIEDFCPLTITLTPQGFEQNVGGFQVWLWLDVGDDQTNS